MIKASGKMVITLFLGDNHVSLIIPVKGEKDKFLISIGREIAIVTWDGESERVSKIEKVYEVDNTPDTSDNRFNDGKCDSSGRLWAGKSDYISYIKYCNETTYYPNYLIKDLKLFFLIIPNITSA